MYFIIPLLSGGEEHIGDFPLDCLGCCCLDFPCVTSVDGMLIIIINNYSPKVKLISLKNPEIKSRGLFNNIN